MAFRHSPLAFFHTICYFVTGNNFQRDVELKMTTRNAHVEQSTWRESLMPLPMAISHPFQSPLLHSPVNEKFAFLGREVGRSDGAGSHTTVYNAYEVTSERFPLATNSSAVSPATWKNRANLFYGKYACHAAPHGKRNRIQPST